MPEPVLIHDATLDELHRRNAELVESVAARDAFIAVAAHELRNPMTPMLGQVDLLLRGLQADRYSAEQIIERLERIRRVIIHYIKRAAAVLDVSRLTTGSFKPEFAQGDLAPLLRQVVETFSDVARYSGRSIQLDAPANLLGHWDRMAVEQIIDNLVSNAIKYGGEGPIEVSAQVGDAAVVIRVRDHGPGISPQDRARIFGRFERGIGVGERHAGFGIGLWVVGQLAAAMEGTITVDSIPGEGSTFALVLPRRAELHGT